MKRPAPLRGRCAGCLYTHPLTKDGRLQTHSSNRFSPPCGGSNELPYGKVDQLTIHRKEHQAIRDWLT